MRHLYIICPFRHWVYYGMALSVCLSLSVRLSVCLSVCLSTSFCMISQFYSYQFETVFPVFRWINTPGVEAENEPLSLFYFNETRCGFLNPITFKCWNKFRSVKKFLRYGQSKSKVMVRLFEQVCLFNKIHSCGIPLVRMFIDLRLVTLISKITEVTKVKFGYWRITEEVLELSTWNLVQTSCLNPDKCLY